VGSTPGLVQGKIPTAAEWNSYFADKQDDLGFTPFSTGGGTITGALFIPASTVSGANLNLAPGVAPTTPDNGDIWSTATGLFTRINGTTVNLTTGVTSGFSGGTLTGKLFTAASTTSLSGLNITPGGTPSSPVAGDVWVTSAGLFANINGTTFNHTLPSQLHTLTLKGSPLAADEVLGWDTVGSQLVKFQVSTLGPANVLFNNATANITVGFTTTPANGGTVSSGTFTPSGALGNYQFYTNNGAHTLAVPGSDTAIDILITNGASAGTISFSGSYAVSSNTGDTLDTTNGHKFIISIRRINGTSTYTVKALQ